MPEIKARPPPMSLDDVSREIYARIRRTKAKALQKGWGEYADTIAQRFANDEWEILQAGRAISFDSRQLKERAFSDSISHNTAEAMAALIERGDL